MYLPRHNHITDQALLHDLMERFNFATLVTAHDGCPVATHLPFILERASGEHGTLIAHLARANPQWHDFAENREVLVIFQGDHAYISPSWYANHPSVPTWNYAVVHAYGVPRIVDDPLQVRAALEALVTRHEAPFERPWTMDGLSGDYVGAMARAIVAFTIPISRLEGKFKLSQNRSAADLQGVVDALDGAGDAGGRGVAAMMRALSGEAPSSGA
jgi:transcriptional regulator